MYLPTDRKFHLKTLIQIWKKYWLSKNVFESLSNVPNCIR